MCMLNVENRIVHTVINLPVLRKFSMCLCSALFVFGAKRWKWVTRIANRWKGNTRTASQKKNIGGCMVIWKFWRVELEAKARNASQQGKIESLMALKADIYKL